MKIVATIEARMTSSRLPGKVLMPVLDKPILAYLIERLQAVSSLDAIILATTTNAADDPLAELARKMDVGVFRGSEDDVMARVVGAAESAGASVIVEITGDCPIIDPELVEQSIRTFMANEADYVSNIVVRSYPDGMDVQVFSLETLRKAADQTDDPLDREHVSRFIWRHPEMYSLLHMVAPPSRHAPDIGLTLDEAADYELIKKIIEHFGPANALFGCGDILEFLRDNPNLVEINQAVLRKGDT
jgi:spore coat polysaccharide biosynthesis protein SpsF